MPKLKYLRPKHQQAIAMKWNNFPYQEIAKELGVSYDTVKSWFRAKGFLRQDYLTYANDQESEKKRRINKLK